MLKGGMLPPQIRPLKVDYNDPSEASGGIPEPTQEYLQQANQDWTKLEKAQPLLIISDLNGTLIFRRDTRTRPKDFVPRPHALQFIDYMMTHFWLGFWSSARLNNMASFVDHLVHPTRRDELAFVWDRSKFGLTPDDYERRTMCYKRLTRIWNDPEIAKTHPDYASGGRWSQANTVLIDDTYEKARSEPYNLIEVSPFEGGLSVPNMELTEVHDYINMLAFQSDVSAYMRIKPFRAKNHYNTPPTVNIPAVTESEDAFRFMNGLRKKHMYDFQSPLQRKGEHRGKGGKSRGKNSPQKKPSKEDFDSSGQVEDNQEMNSRKWQKQQWKTDKPPAPKWEDTEEYQWERLMQSKVR